MPDTEHGELQVTLNPTDLSPLRARIYIDARDRYTAVIVDDATGATVTLDQGMLDALEIHAGSRARRRRAKMRAAGLWE